MKNKKLVIFDFDGVIHDTFEFHRGKIGEFTGSWLSDNDFRDIHNGNFFINKNDQLANVDWEAYRDFIYEHQSSLKMDVGIKEMLFELGKIYDLCVISSGGTKNISDYLENNGVDEVFKEILGMESYRSKIDKFNFIFKKYSVNSQDCVFITDTLGDILEANEVSVKTIAVEFGFHSKETLEKGNPAKIIDNPLFLTDSVKEILG